jgi:hypothetical protein
MAKVNFNISLTEEERDTLKKAISILDEVCDTMERYKANALLNIYTYELKEEKDLRRVANFIDDINEGVWVMEKIGN